jgi:hypothetical protein
VCGLDSLTAGFIFPNKKRRILSYCNSPAGSETPLYEPTIYRNYSAYRTAAETRLHLMPFCCTPYPTPTCFVKRHILRDRKDFRFRTEGKIYSRRILDNIIVPLVQKFNVQDEVSIGIYISNQLYITFSKLSRFICATLHVSGVSCPSSGVS